MIKPRKLQVGDKLAAVSLSWGGPGTFPHRYEAGKRQLEETFGVSLVAMPNTLRDADYLYKNPQARADDLMQAFSDPSIKGIISTIGGDDSMRLLPLLDLDVIRTNPKIFMGYSDTTVTHMACFKAGLTSFYGPAIMAGFAENCGMFSYMKDAVTRSLFQSAPLGLIEPCREGWTVEQLDWGNPALQTQRRTLTPSTGPKLLQGTGRVEGPLIGGCSEVLEMVKGTAVWPETSVWDGAILFLENSEDMPSVAEFTYWLRNYGAQGILARINGIIFGRPGGATMPPAQFAEYDAALCKVVGFEYGRPDLPILSQMDFGHTDPMFIIPYGVRAQIDCATTSFSVVESAVMD